MYTTEEIINDYTTEELLEITLEYSGYVQDYPADHKGGGYPVSFMEWYENDYQEMLKNN